MIYQHAGLCANIGPDEMEELKFGGEWILAEDETLVADGHEQRYLYMVVLGEVGFLRRMIRGKASILLPLRPELRLAKWLFLVGELHRQVCRRG